MVDVETSGPVIGRHALTEIGAVVGSAARGVIDRFEALLSPGAAEVQTSRDSFERAQREGEPPAKAMQRFADWCRPHLEKKALFIARPAAFDWPWIVWYAWTHLKKNPFGFRAVCASSWFMARGERFEVELPHVAVRDAEIQLVHFLGLSDAVTVGDVGVACVAFDPDGRRVAAGSWAESVQIWDVATRRRQVKFAGHERSVYCVAFSPDGTRMASGDGEDDEKPGRIAVWDTVTGAELAWLGPFPWSVAGVAWSPDGTRIASACYDGELRIHDTRTRKLMHNVRAGQNELNTVAWSADGRWVATGGRLWKKPRPVKLWDATTLEPGRELKGHASKIRHVAFARDGRLAALSTDNGVWIWNCANGRVLRTIESAEALAGLAFDGERVVCGVGQDVRAWNATTGAELTSRSAARQSVNCVALHPDGKHIAVGAGRCAGDGELWVQRL